MNHRIGRRRWFSLLLLLASYGCRTAPPAEARFSWEFYSAPGISASTFAGESVAILPTVGIEYDPAQEVYRETLAGSLYLAIIKNAEGLHVLSPDDLKNSINKHGLGTELQQMFREYRETSVLRKDILMRIGEAAGARYIILPRLLRFQSETFDRANIAGISFLRTRQSSVDIYAQIWDTKTGEAIWEGASEGTIASEVLRGRPASFMAVAANACESLAMRMPWMKK